MDVNIGNKNDVTAAFEHAWVGLTGASTSWTTLERQAARQAFELGVNWGAARARQLDSELLPDWGNRDTASHRGWVNELLTLSEHHGAIPGFARRAMRTIARGLTETAATPAGATHD